MFPPGCVADFGALPYKIPGLVASSMETLFYLNKQAYSVQFDAVKPEHWLPQSWIIFIT